MNPVVAALLSWTFDPLVVAGLLLYALLWIRGARTLARYGGFERQIGGNRLAAAVTGWLTLLVALLSPIAVFGGFFLTAHMVQHLLLTQIAAPLLLLGRPVPTLMLGLPDTLAKNVAPLLARDGPLYPIGAWLTTPVVGLIVFLAVFFGWHIPLLYDAAIKNPVIHDLEHLTFFWASILFWWPAIDPIGGRNGRRRYLTLVTVTLAFFAANALGIVLTFAGGIVYPSYQTGPKLFGFSPRDDQISGGLIMWIGGSLLYAVSAIAVLGSAMHEEERAVRRQEAREAALTP